MFSAHVLHDGRGILCAYMWRSSLNIGVHVGEPVMLYNAV